MQIKTKQDHKDTRPANHIKKKKKKKKKLNHSILIREHKGRLV